MMSFPRGSAPPCTGGPGSGQQAHFSVWPELPSTQQACAGLSLLVGEESDTAFSPGDTLL